LNWRDLQLISLMQASTLWATRKEDCWKSVDWLASLGVIATPGIFYGSDGSQHIRIAMTATDIQINDAAARIVKAVQG